MERDGFDADSSSACCKAQLQLVLKKLICSPTTLSSFPHLNVLSPTSSPCCLPSLRATARIWAAATDSSLRLNEFCLMAVGISTPVHDLTCASGNLINSKMVTQIKYLFVVKGHSFFCPYAALHACTRQASVSWQT